MQEIVVGPGEALGNREVWQLGLAELDLDIAPFGDPQRVVARLRQLGPEVAHLGSRLHVVLITGELEPIRIRHQGSGLDTQQSVVRFVVVLLGVVRVVGRQQRRTDLASDLEQLGVGGPLFGDPVILDLDEEVVFAEDVLEPGGLLERHLVVARHDGLQHLTSEAA